MFLTKVKCSSEMLCDRRTSSATILICTLGIVNSLICVALFAKNFLALAFAFCHAFVVSKLKEHE